MMHIKDSLSPDSNDRRCEAEDDGKEPTREVPALLLAHAETSAG
jgi:hypothetical protein